MNLIANAFADALVAIAAAHCLAEFMYSRYGLRACQTASISIRHVIPKEEEEIHYVHTASKGQRGDLSGHTVRPC